MIRFSPLLPEQRLPCRPAPLLATYFLLYRKSIRVDIWSSTTTITSPPRPPSPPSGPPEGMYFSGEIRRRCAFSALYEYCGLIYEHGLPPVDMIKYIFSYNLRCCKIIHITIIIMGTASAPIFIVLTRRQRPFSVLPRRSNLTMPLFRAKGIVFATAHVGAGVDLSTALSDKDVAGYKLSVGSLGAKPF